MIDRRNTDCVKYDGLQDVFGCADLLPMWVADMDFRPPAPVQAAVERLAAHGVYGYPAQNPDYLPAIQWWMENRHGWNIDPAHVFTTHGLVNAVGLCLQAFRPMP